VTTLPPWREDRRGSALLLGRGPHARFIAWARDAVAGPTHFEALETLGEATSTEHVALDLPGDGTYVILLPAGGTDASDDLRATLRRLRPDLRELDQGPAWDFG
jgi:hypothetical protein